MNFQPHQTRVTTKHREDGYVALVSVIILTMALLILSATVSATSFQGRFMILGFEDKKISSSAAEGCLEYARLKITVNPLYTPITNGESVTTQGATCKVCAVSGTGLTRTVLVRGKQNNSTTNLSATVNIGLQDFTVSNFQEIDTYSGPACPM